MDNGVLLLSLLLLLKKSVFTFQINPNELGHGLTYDVTSVLLRGRWEVSLEEKRVF